ncbi:MAG: Cache 3/Cache 2 fusion domain-containing protein [Candidatus Riflebacteria bacterium]|nr:Cache 3/Cache 2 fusion domain-containing protein [Candidatus Riflebacteria bacterium]
MLRNRLKNFPVKIRIFIPILLIIVLSVSLVTWYSVYVSNQNLYELVENYLRNEVQSLKIMFEREHELKLLKAKKDMRVIDSFFHHQQLRISDEKIDFSIRFPDAEKNCVVSLNKWYLGDSLLHNNFDFVDTIEKIVGSKATIFQKSEVGFVRISTNVMDNNNARAVGTVIPFDSPIVDSINKSEHYFGRAYVVNDWYVTGYEPIYFNDEVVGMLFVGTREKDLPELSRKFMKLNIGKSGYPFVFDKTGEIVINHDRAQHDWVDKVIINAIVEQKTGLKRFLSPVDGKRKIIAFDYFPEFELYIAAFVNESEETRQMMRHLIYGSVIVSLLLIMVISITVYFMTIEKLHGYLEALKNRDQELYSAKEALEQSEKLATMGQLAAGIAHEVNNPLGVVLMYSHLLMEDCEPTSRIYKDLETVATQANRCKTIVSGLLNFARKNQINKKEVRLGQFIESIRKNLVIPGTVAFSIISDCSEDEIAIDEAQMTQVFVNLVNNSIDAVKSSGEIILSASTDGQHVFFKVEDNGAGISEENQKHLFEPFFSTKEMGKGTGLGLAVCYGIVKMHNGKIDVESCADPAKGKTFTRFVITLPQM